MKTKVLVFTVLLLGGMIVTSCKKDNALLNDNASELSIANTTKNVSSDTTLAFYLTNYPNPFDKMTTIEYKLKQKDFVKLTVYSEITGFETILAKEWQAKGVYTYQLNTSMLRPGNYIAELIVHGDAHVQVLTKKEPPSTPNDSWAF